MCENIRGVKVVQGMIREPVNYTLYEEKANDHFKSTVRAAKIAQIMLPTVDTLTGLAMAIIVVVGGGFVLEGELTAGVMIAYILFVQRFFDPIRSLTIQYSVMQRAMASGQRIFEVTDVDVDKVGKVNTMPVGGLCEELGVFDAGNLGEDFSSCIL